MRKNIHNVDPVTPIVRKPRLSNHKTFGEGIIHGDFTFNNKDYAQANWFVRTFGHSKFIKIFLILFFQMLIWGGVTALVPMLFSVLADAVYKHEPEGVTIYKCFLYTSYKFNYINIIVATAWTLMAVPIVGNYLGRNQTSKMREAVRFLFYLLMATCTTAMIIELIYAPEIVTAIIFKKVPLSDISASNMQKLQSMGSVFATPKDYNAYTTAVQTAFKLKYAIIAVRYFAFVSYFVGWASLYAPMFGSMRRNRTLILSTFVGLVFFLVVFCSYLYGAKISTSSIETNYTVAGKSVVGPSFEGYYKFNPFINTTCGIYIGYVAIIPAFIWLYCHFPAQFKLSTIAASAWFKSLYNGMVDKQSRYEYKISQVEYKKYKIEKHISYLKERIELLNNKISNRKANALYSQADIDKLNAKDQNTIAKLSNELNSNLSNWENKIQQYSKNIDQLNEKLVNTPKTNKKLFYIDYFEKQKIDDFEKNFLWFSGENSLLILNPLSCWLIKHLHIKIWDNRTSPYFDFKVSGHMIKNIFETALGALCNQLAFGTFGLILVIFSQNFNGDILGDTSTTVKEGATYFKSIEANAGLISSWLALVYAGFTLIPQYFVAYYLGRGDRETAYHNSLILVHWGFIVGAIICVIVLIYGCFINAAIYPSDGQIYVSSKYTGVSTANFTTYQTFYNHCFIMEAILAVVEIGDGATAMSFFILIAGACKWTFFSDQMVRIVNIIALLILFYGANPETEVINGVTVTKTVVVNGVAQPVYALPGVHWFSMHFSANMFVYYIVARSHSVVPAFISWFFIERGWALRDMKKEDDEELNSYTYKKGLRRIRLNNKLNKKQPINVDSTL